MKRFIPRFSFTTVALAALALFSLAIVVINEFHVHAEQQEFIDHIIQQQHEMMALVFENQMRSGAIEDHQVAEAFSEVPDIVWVEVVPVEGGSITAANSPTLLPPAFGIPTEALFDITQAASAEGNSGTQMVQYGDHSLAAYPILDSYVLVALFDRTGIQAKLDDSYRLFWIMISALVATSGFMVLFVSRCYLQKPIERLSRALDEAEDTLHLHLDKRLPDNEIGKLGRHIGEWLDRLRSTQHELERMAVVAEHTQSAVIVLGADLRTQWVNKAFTKMTGYCEAEVIGRLPRDYMRGPESDTGIANTVDQSFAHGKGFVLEAKICRKDGTYIWVAAEAQPVRNDEGIITGWVCADTDITERKQAEDQLALRILDLEASREQQTQLAIELEAAKKAAEHSNASKSEFLANMSHEIRTPMNGVLGMADVLLTTDLSSDQLEFVQTIKESGAGLLVIINDILDLSKLESGKIALDKSNTDVARIAKSVTELMTPRANAKDVCISFEVSPEVPKEVVEDGGRLRQVLLNLVGNAIKFTNEGTIKLEVRLTGKTGRARYLRFEVIDTGIGISEEYQKKLFQRFEQGDVAAARAAGGTGLGLSICRELTWLMGGEIGLTSEKDKGSTFWIEIPFLAAQKKSEGPISAVSETAKPMPTKNAQGGNGSLHLLVAEDHQVNQALMKAFVAKLGHQLTIAPDGVDTVKAVRNGSYDMVLMDIQMPRMDGVMATKVIRSLESGPSDIPIIAVTANAMAGQRDHYIESGMDGYVSKPVQLEELRNEIDRVWAEHSERSNTIRNAS